MGRQNLGHGDFKIFHHLLRDRAFIHVLRGCKRFLQTAALIHSGCCNDALCIGQGLHVFQFTGGNTHKIPLFLHAAKVGFRALYISEYLILQRFRSFKLTFVPQAQQKLHADVGWG